MKPPLEHLVDACLAQLNSGQDLEAVLAMHPEEADELRPALAAAAWVRMDIPGPSRRLEGKQALLDAVVQRRREVEVTQGYINELKAGVPLASMLETAAPAMRPLLIAAWRMHTTEVPGPAPERVAEGKQLVMAMAARKRAAALQSRQAALRWPARTLLTAVASWPRARLARRAWSGAFSAIAATMVLAVGVTRVSTAAADSLPGDAFYQVKRLGESAQMLFAFDPARKAELEVRFMAHRKAELARLLEPGQPIAESAIRDWFAGQDNAMIEIRRLPRASQERLGEGLRSLVDRGVPVEAWVDDAARTALRDWLAEVAPPVNALAVPTAAPAASEAPSLSVPMPVERPLPPDDRARSTQPTGVEAQRPAVVAPVPADPNASGGDPASAQPPLPVDFFAQSGSEPRRDDDDDDRNTDRGNAAPGAADPAAPATATAEPPEIIMVPMGPTATPAPGGGTEEPGGGGAAPGASEPVAPPSQP